MIAVTAEGDGEAAHAATGDRRGEAVGEVILSTSVAAAYGVYLLLTGDPDTLSASVLIAGGASSALLIHLYAKVHHAEAALPRHRLMPVLLVVPLVFALYLLVVIGLLAFAQAIIGHAGFWAIVTGLFWAFDGSRLLFVLSRMRLR